MRAYCTLFDQNYLPRGLAMYDSLRKVSSDFHLYVVAFDELSHATLRDLKLPNLTSIPLSEFEDEALLAVKNTRSSAEYCWTSTPSVIRHCIHRYNLAACTYLDADLWFFSDPEPIFREIGTASVCITEHGFSEGYLGYRAQGIYCVQFMFFRNDDDGMKVLNWWRDQCLNWCFNRLEDGRFGDQKYLDDWTTRFSGVHSVKNIGAGIAPWNVARFHFSHDSGGRIIANEGTTRAPIVFYHFHNVALFRFGFGVAKSYRLTRSVVNSIYSPYLKVLWEVYRRLPNYFVTKGIGISPLGRSAEVPLWNSTSKTARLDGTRRIFFDGLLYLLGLAPILTFRIIGLTVYLVGRVKRIVAKYLFARQKA